ncbi:16837_t:CDS:2, partial [Racocetra fulgida]
PPSSGKTSLVREVVCRGNFNPLFIDLRGGQFSTPTNLYYTISEQFYSFFERTKDKLSGMQTGVKLHSKLLNTLSADVDLRLQPSEKNAKEIAELLGMIEDHLPRWSFWKGRNVPPPILIIDEANKFSQLCSSAEGAIILESFLDWLVKNTKQEKNFHVVLTTADSFFSQWISKMLHVPHTTSYVVGDLSRKEAEEFFYKHVLPRHGSDVHKELEGRFDHVYEITGTRMIIINQYVDEYKIHKGDFEVYSTEFSVYLQEYNRLERGFYPEVLESPSKRNSPLWNRSDFIKTMEAIVANPEFILEDDLIQLI